MQWILYTLGFFYCRSTQKYTDNHPDNSIFVRGFFRGDCGYFYKSWLQALTDTNQQTLRKRHQKKMTA